MTEEIEERINCLSDKKKKFVRSVFHVHRVLDLEFSKEEYDEFIDKVDSLDDDSEYLTTVDE